jgi:hypothetical protein
MPTPIILVARCAGLLLPAPRALRSTDERKVLERLFHPPSCSALNLPACRMRDDEQNSVTGGARELGQFAIDLRVHLGRSARPVAVWTINVLRPPIIVVVGEDPRWHHPVHLPCREAASPPAARPATQPQCQAGPPSLALPTFPAKLLGSFLAAPASCAHSVGIERVIPPGPSPVPRLPLV